MRGRLKYLLGAALLSFVLCGPGFAAAAQPDAQMWETTEDAKFLDANGKEVFPPFGPGNMPVTREASSALSGYAKVDTLWCPREALVTRPDLDSCTVMARGSNSVSLLDGKGTFTGRFWVVLQDGNPFDPAELIALTGTFGGKIDFSPTLFLGVPIGTIDGTVTIAGGKGPHVGKRFQLSGTFRQPFGLDPSNPGTAPFFYFNDAVSGSFEPIQPNELVLGSPVPRFDVTFGGRVRGH